MATTHQLKGGTSRSSGFSSTTIADGATGTGSAIDNATNLDLFLSAEFSYSYGTSPTANKTVNIYLTYSIDGTNYEDVGNACLIGSFSPSADTSSHREMRIKNWPLLPYKFKIVVVNVDTGQTITLTVASYTHNEQDA